MKILPDIANGAANVQVLPEKTAEASRDACYQHLVDAIGIRATVAERIRVALRVYSPNSTALALVNGGVTVLTRHSNPVRIPESGADGARRRLQVWVNEALVVAPSAN